MVLRPSERSVHVTSGVILRQLPCCASDLRLERQVRGRYGGAPGENTQELRSAPRNKARREINFSFSFQRYICKVPLAKLPDFNEK